MTTVAKGNTRPAKDVLREHNFSGERLLKLSRRIAHDELRRRGAWLDESRFEDLVGFLALAGVRAATRFDPDRQHSKYGRDGGDPFASWMADVLSHRVTDWYRHKSEGNGDRRYGGDNRIVLAPADDDAFAVDVGLDFEEFVSERRVLEWQRAAEAVELPLAEWIAQTLDLAARAIRRSAKV